MKNTILLFFVISLAACNPVTPVLVFTEIAPAATRAPSSVNTTEVAGLTILIGELADQPSLDPLTFKSVNGNSFDATTMGSGERFDYHWMENMPMSMWAMLGNKQLVATEKHSQDGMQGWVTIMDDDQEIYRIDIGKGSPITGLRGIWSYDNHWVLETNYYTDDAPFSGRITEDGVLLNEKYGYEEAFNFQTIGGRPFYFFLRDGKVNAWYDGQEIDLGFDNVPHYGCCSYGELNPHQWTTMVAFFGVRGDTWYFIQIGHPDSFK